MLWIDAAALANIIYLYTCLLIIPLHRGSWIWFFNFGLAEIFWIPDGCFWYMKSHLLIDARWPHTLVLVLVSSIFAYIVYAVCGVNFRLWKEYSCITSKAVRLRMEYSWDFVLCCSSTTVYLLSHDHAVLTLESEQLRAWAPCLVSSGTHMTCWTSLAFL